ncbi:MAG: class B sortase [Clostridia bacterium]|nr:class B sortase [Clostridia bacterium]
MPRRNKAVIDTLILPRRRAYRRRRRARVMFWLCGAVVVVSAVMLISRLSLYGRARDEYDTYRLAMSSEVTANPTQEVRAVLSDPPPAAVMEVSSDDAAERETPAVAAQPSPAPFRSPTVSQLIQNNRDTVGWLSIPGTSVQYPLMRGNDNAYYTNHTFKREKNASGAIFMDAWNARDLSDFNTVVYGHNMKDGSMFGNLGDYHHQSYFNAHSTIEIILEDRKLIYKTFAVYQTPDGSSVDFRGQNCISQAERAEFIRAARKRSTGISSNITVARQDRLLTLVTCVGGSRLQYWVVHAVLTEVIG